jgi:hypothetical protein
VPTRTAWINLGRPGQGQDIWSAQRGVKPDAGVNFDVALG